MQGQLGILPGFFEANSPMRICETIIEGYFPAIKGRVNMLSHETLGRIVACGLSHEDPDYPNSVSLHDAMGDIGQMYFGQTRYSGLSHLLTLAYYTVIAAMADNIRHDNAKPRGFSTTEVGVFHPRTGIQTVISRTESCRTLED